MFVLSRHKISVFHEEAEIFIPDLSWIVWDVETTTSRRELHIRFENGLEFVSCFSSWCQAERIDWHHFTTCTIEVTNGCGNRTGKFFPGHPFWMPFVCVEEWLSIYHMLKEKPKCLW